MIRPEQPDWRDVQGLTQAEADARLRTDGHNELPDARHRSIVAIAPLFEVATIRARLPVVTGSTPAATVAPIVSGALGAAFVAFLLLRIGQGVRDRRDGG